MSTPVYAIWGMPILGSVLPAQLPTYSSADFVGSLVMSIANPCTRRLGFPSWSWTGWNGRAALHEEITATKDVKVSFCDVLGAEITWDNMIGKLSMHEVDEHSILPILNLQCWTFEVQIIQFSNSCTQPTVKTQGFVPKCSTDGGSIWKEQSSPLETKVQGKYLVYSRLGTTQYTGISSLRIDLHDDGDVLIGAMLSDQDTFSDNCLLLKHLRDNWEVVGHFSTNPAFYLALHSPYLRCNGTQPDLERRMLHIV